MKTKINPLNIVPNNESKSEDWIAFYNALKKRFGKNAANILFAKSWGQYGRGEIIGEVEIGTGLELEKNAWQKYASSIEKSVDIFGGLVNTAQTGTKILFYGGITVAVLIGLGLTYKLFTLTAQDAGKAAGYAAKVYTGKP